LFPLWTRKLTQATEERENRSLQLMKGMLLATLPQDHLLLWIKEDLIAKIVTRPSGNRQDLSARQTRSKLVKR